MKSTDSFEHFFKATHARGKLIFAQIDQLDEIEQLAATYGYPEPTVDTADLELFSNVGKRVIVVTPEQQLILRGSDFRNPFGIDLLIATEFATERAYIQALGRVGRGTDPCGRFLLKGTSPVDKIAEAELNGCLMKEC